MEAVEVLAETVSSQAGLIVKLCSVLEQHNIVTTLDEEIENVQRQAASALAKGGGQL